MTVAKDRLETGFVDGLRWEHGVGESLQPWIEFDDERRFELGSWLGAQLTLRHAGKLRCPHCGRATKKSFSQGYCFPCFKKLARCDLCIVSPTRCHRAQGTCREPDWADRFCMSPHLVYLANSSGLKVGLTRGNNELNRWADQGASQGLVIAECDTRIAAGALEALIAERHSDRTDWRKLVRGPAEPLDLITLREQVKAELDGVPDGVRWVERNPVTLTYPVLDYGPVKSRNLDKEQAIEGTV